MKTKQATIKAIFTASNDNAVNHGHKLETVASYQVIDKKSERSIITARVYMGRSSSANQVKASVWVSLSDKNKPESWEYGYTSGSGQAGGYGYDKESSAIESAIESAGIELYGTAYQRRGEKVDFKKRAYIGGVGSQAVETALLAIAYAAGYNDCILVK